MRITKTTILWLIHAVLLVPLILWAQPSSFGLLIKPSAVKRLTNLATIVALQQQQATPRKYIIKPMNLGINTEIRARSTRNLQVQVTDENDRPVPDAPVLFLLGGNGSGSASAGSVAGQTSLRAVTNAQGFASVEFTAADTVGSAMRLEIRVEGSEALWQGTLSVIRALPTTVASQQSQTVPRKYMIQPMNLGTNTEIRARSTRNLQVQVTDENDHPMPDVPLLFLLSAIGSGSSKAGIVAGQSGSSGAQALAGQTSLRALTNQYGIANMNLTAPDSVGSAMQLQIQVEGSDVVWQGRLSLVQAEAGVESSQNASSPDMANSLLTLDAEEKACTVLINQFREENLQPPVKVSVKLTNAAKWLSHDNADNKPDDPDHTDSLGRDLRKRLVDFGYQADVIKENIVVGAKSAVEALVVWKGSGFHIRNLLSSEMTVIGVGRVCKNSAKSSCHWSVILGSTKD